MKKKVAGRAPAKSRKVAKARSVKVGAEVLEGLKQALAHQRGEHVPGLIVRGPVGAKVTRNLSRQSPR
jgi:hypothetical protein